MRLLAGLALLLIPAAAWGQAVVTSSRPDKVAVTVYRDPYGRGRLEIGWLNGFAMISETRRVRLPAGDVDLRFEGVTAGILPQSAIVTGLGDALIEKNRDAMLLSPGTLLDAYLGQRVHLKRTFRATGEVREEEAVIRQSEQGVVIQTAAGFEALRCTGFDETLRPERVPATLSAKPTLSTRLRLSKPVDAEVTLTYLSSNFDWRAHYVATQEPDGTTSLFAWLTLANGDSTGLADADTYAVAGRLNRDNVRVPPPYARQIMLNCWPSDTTSDIPEDDEDYAGGPPPPPPPPPPAAPVMMESAQAIVVTGSRVAAKAEQENLGDLKLYRIPIPVTVAARSQKQVAMIEQPAVRFRTVYRYQAFRQGHMEAPVAPRRVLLVENKKAEGLGLPLPAGSFTLFAMRAGQPILIGEGEMTDRAIGEKVEVYLDQGLGVRILQTQLKRQGKAREATLLITNDSAEPQPVEILFEAGSKVTPVGATLGRRDGQPLWAVTVPANAARTLRYRWTEGN